MKEVIELLKTMSHNTINNYVIPGLSSSLLGERHEKGSVRLFSSSRNHHEVIIPHNHRHAFSCLVLRGTVLNTVWEPANLCEGADMYNFTYLKYGNAPGQYEIQRKSNPVLMRPIMKGYAAGDWYSMEACEIHSIKFSKDAEVLFFSGPNTTDTTIVLEPIVNDEVVPTFKVEDWMFHEDL